MQNPGSTSPRSVIWKNRVDSCDSYEDEQLRRVVDILKNGDELSFVRWIRFCDDINMRDSFGNSTLHWAAVLGDVRALTHLLLSGARVDATNINDATPLHCAAYGGHVSVIEQLLRYGADAMAKNCEGKNMFDVLREMKWDSVSLLYSPLENALSNSFVCNRDIIDVRFFEGAVLGLTSSSPEYRNNNNNNNNMQLKLTYIADDDFKGGSNNKRHCDNNDYTYDNYGEPHTETSSLLLQDELEKLGQCSELVQICAEEAAERCNVIREYAQCMLNVVQIFNNEKSFIGLANTREVEIVFGEKYSSSGTRLLLVRMVGDAEGAEMWVSAEKVAHCRKVAEYMDRLEYAGTAARFLNGKTDGRQSSSGGDPLNTVEKRFGRKQSAQRSYGTSPVKEAGKSNILPLHKELAPLRKSPSMVGKSQATAANVNSLCEVFSKECTLRRNRSKGKMVSKRDTATAYGGEYSSGDRLWKVRSFLPYVNEKKTSFLAVEAGKKVPDAHNNNNNNNHTNVVDKLPYLRQRLSEKERLEYDAILRRSAMRYLMRKREETRL